MVPRKFSLFYCLIVILCVVSFSHSTLENTKDFEKLPGFQIYNFEDRLNYMFTSIVGMTDSLQITIYLLHSKTPFPKNGVWASIGFGTPGMHGSDMIICTYKQGRGKDGVDHECRDYYSEGHSPIPDIELGGTNDVEFAFGNQSFTLKQEEWAPYKSQISWNFTKIFNKKDKFDWKKIKSWDRYSRPIISAHGLLKDNGDIDYHSDYNSQKLIDGTGLPIKKKVVIEEPQQEDKPQFDENGNEIKKEKKVDL